MKRVLALATALLLVPLLVRLLLAQSPPPSQPTYFVVSVPAVVTPTPALVTVGGVFNFMVTIRDQFNNPVPSYTGTVHLTSTDPQAMLPGDYTITTGDSGTHTFSATLNTAGSQTITATDTANTAITGTSNSIAVSSTPASPGPTFTLTDLGPLNIAAAPSGATALNASGQVTGFRFQNFATQVCFASGANRAFLWDNGVYTELWTLGGYSSSGYGINNAGQIVGSSDLCPNGLEVGQRAFLWQNGSMTALDPSTNSNDSSAAYAINTNGDVAGYLNHANAPVEPQAVIWKGGTAAGLTLLGPLACQFAPNCQTRALAINDSGQAAGWGMGPFVVTARAGSYNANQAVRWDANGQATGLGSLGNYWADQANAINSNGDVVGYSQLDPGVYYAIARAVLWQNGNPQTPQDLGTIPGIDPLFGTSANVTDNSSVAWGINSKGFIVGVSGSGSNVAAQGNSGRAFLYIPATTPGNPGTMYDLLSLLAPGTNWRRLEAAWAINDNGQIVGVGIDANQQEHGFLLSPIITSTTTAVTSSMNPSVFGQQVSFTATVAPTQSAALTPTGSVTFSDGSTVLGTVALRSGSATFSSSALGVGTHTITVSYAGDNNFGSSTSAALSQTVSLAATTTTLAASPNPSSPGQTVTITATVAVVAPGSSTPTAPTGMVTFVDGTTTIGNGLLNGAGNVTFAASSLSAGNHSITATYRGDANFRGSTTSSSVTVTVQPPPPVQITDNETITVTDTESFPDVFDAEAVHVSDAAFVTPLIQVSAPVAEFSAGSVGFSGQSGSQTVTVSDIGLASLTLASATVSGSSQFTITQVACSNNATSLSTVLQSGGVCTFTIGYAASATPANDNGLLTFTDNAGLSNLQVFPSGSSYTQSIPLNGLGVTTAPPPPPPAVIPIAVSETIQVTDAQSFPDVFNAEAVHVSDVVFVTPEINVAAPVAEFSAGSVGFSGQSGSQTITVSDIGQRSLTIASATISGSSQFAVTQISCTNNATSFSTVLPSGSVCAVTLGYTPSATPANDNAVLTFTDNAALSNVTSSPAGSSYTQSIPLSGSGTTTAAPPPPPSVIPVMDNETITVTDTESFPDVFDAEAVHVADAAFVTPLIQVSAPVAEFSAGSVGFSGQSGSQTVTVSDIGLASLTLTSATISGSSQFAIAQIACSNSATSFSTALSSGGACTLTIGYTASAKPANDLASLIFTDNAALSNLQVVPLGSSYTQSIPLSGSGTSTAPPPPPPAVIPVMDNETIHVTDAESFPDFFDPETIKVTDQVLVQAYPLTTTSVSGSGVTYGTPALATVSVSSASGPVTGSVTLSVDGGTPSALPLTNSSATFNLGVLNAGTHSLLASFTTQGGFSGSSASAALTVRQATPVITWPNPVPIPYGTALSSTQLNAITQVSGTFAYTPPAGTLLSAGSHTLSVNFSPSDAADYTTATASVTITVLNTTVGTGVGVTPVDTTTGLTPVTLNFSNVTKAGITSLTTSSTGVAPPPSFEVPTPIVYYDISTTATFTGTVQVCFHYGNLLFFGSTAPHVFHLEGGVWVDRTTTIDSANLVVCGVVPSLSPFALFAPKPVLTITANNASRQFGAPEPSFSVSYSGFVGTDTPGVLSGTLSCSSTDTATSPVGTYTINCSGLGSPNYVVRYAAGVLTVTPASTTTRVSVSPSPVKYSDYTTLTATVSPASAGGQTLTGNVQFSLNGITVGSAVPISSSGVATLSQAQVNLSAGSYPVKAVFSSTNGNFAGSSGSTPQTVTQENAFILYSGGTIAQVGTLLNLRATVWDSAAVGYPGTNPETGSTATIGDITKMWIAFDIYPAGSCGSGTPSTVYAHAALTGTPGVGTATTSASSSSEVSYCVVSRLVAGSSGGTNLYYTAPVAQAVGIDFYVNSGQFATGGGWVNDPTGSHGNFGFNARYNSTGSPKGQMVYIYRNLYNGVLADFIIKSNALSALQFSGTTYPISSTLQGKVNIQVNRASDGYTLFSAGNYTFSAIATDSGQTGASAKQFSLIVYDTSGVPYHSVPAGTPLQGGNVVVHSQ